VIVRETHRALEPGSSRCAYRSTILSDGQPPIISTARSDTPFATITVAPGYRRVRGCGPPSGAARRLARLLSLFFKPLHQSWLLFSPRSNDHAPEHR
jgi:hypothetical protein